MSDEVRRMIWEYEQGICNDDPYDVIGALIGHIDVLHRRLIALSARDTIERYGDALDRLADS